MLDEPVVLAPYDAEWPIAAAAEIERLREVLGPCIVDCEHFGSTSVPGCEAKPIVDLLVGLVEWPVASDVRSRLAGLGYEHLGEAGVPGRIYFRKRGGQPAFNLAATRHGSDLWHDNLAIRDLLRRDPAMRMRYIDVKRAALRSGKNMLLAYSEHKNPFMGELLASARAKKPE
ncbi:MAG: GrpB family protein [Polyangiaceae bacterium]